MNHDDPVEPVGNDDTNAPQPVEPQPPDRLAALFAMQRELNRFTMANNDQSTGKPPIIGK